eukprot:2673713-Rhodomonas_salina.6
MQCAVLDTVCCASDVSTPTRCASDVSARCWQARYAEGARYAKHRDVSAKCPDRRLTCIYYFND